MNPKIKISQLPAKGANLAGADLLEIAEFTGTGYVSKSITGQEIIDAAAGAGGVTDVTATAPIESTGGTTPDISIRQSGSLDDGYLSSSDWIAFNNKQDALTLTTTGTSGAATLVGATLNIPQYSGGGGASGIHAFNPLSGQSVSATIIAASFSGSSAVNNRLMAYPFIPTKTFTCSSLYMNCQIQQAGALARILIYSNLNNLPNTKLFESANLDLSTTGAKTAATTFTFNAGTTYWLALHTQGTPTLTHISANSLLPIRQVAGAAPTTFLTTATIYPIGSAPSPFGNYDFNAGNVFLIGITVA